MIEHINLFILLTMFGSICYVYYRLKTWGGSESMDKWGGGAILALEVVPKKILPKNLFYKILCLLFQQGKLCATTNLSRKNGQ